MTDIRFSAASSASLRNKLHRLARQQIRSTSQKTYSIYVLRVVPNQNATKVFDFYVGSTAKSPSQRLAEHRSRKPGTAARIFINGSHTAVEFAEEWMVDWPQFATEEAALAGEALVAKHLSLAGFQVKSDQLRKLKGARSHETAKPGSNSEVRYFIDSTDIVHMQSLASAQFSAACGTKTSEVWWSDDWQPANYRMCATCDDMHPYVLVRGRRVHRRSKEAAWISICGIVLNEIKWQGDEVSGDQLRCATCSLGKPNWEAVPQAELSADAAARKVERQMPKIKVVRGGAPGLGGR